MGEIYASGVWEWDRSRQRMLALRRSVTGEFTARILSAVMGQKWEWSPHDANPCEDADPCGFYICLTTHSNEESATWAEVWRNRETHQWHGTREFFTPDGEEDGWVEVGPCASALGAVQALNGAREVARG